MIKVLHFELSQNIGGIETFLFNMHSAIDRNQFQFDYVTTSNKPALKDKFEALGGHIHYLSSYFALGELKNLMADYDIIHIHKNSCANVIPFVVAKSLHKKIIAHSHNTSPTKKGIATMLHYLNRGYVNRHSDVCLACSQIAGNWLFTRSFEVIRNGIDANAFRFDENRRKMARDTLGMSQDAYVIGHIGRFVEQKNHARLIEVFNTIQKDNIYLLCIGDGPLLPSLKEHYANSNIILPGVRSDIADCLMAMDVFFMPSLHEGLPIVCIEAQASGLPLVLADTISKETDIVGQTKWFALQDKNEDIAHLLFEQGTDRLIANEKLKKAGYDRTLSAQRLMKIYGDI